MNLIGRQHDLDALLDAQRVHRVVTVVGPAGVGKTALARQACIDARAPASFVFVDLSNARSTDGVLSAMAAPLNIQLIDAHSVDDAHQRLREALRAKEPCLVVVDNCEHRLADVRALIPVLARDTTARFLLTSREPVRVNAEHVMELAPLDVHAAVALLKARRPRTALAPTRSHDDAKALVVDGADTDEWNSVAARVVEKIDCLPLAIELLAGRLGILSLAQLEARLSAPLSVLRDAHRATLSATTTGVTFDRESETHGSPRHADLASAIEWSWNLLSSSEKDTLAAVSAFPAGPTFDALCDMRRAMQRASVDVPVDDNAGDGGTAPNDRARISLNDESVHDALLDDLTSLRDRHTLLCVNDDDGTVRYRLLATVRAFVARTIDVDGRRDDVTRAHAVAMVDDARPTHADTRTGLRALAHEVDNLWAVVDGAAHIAPAAAAKAGLMLHRHFALHGPTRAHLDVLDRAIVAARAAFVPQLLLRLLVCRGDIRRKVGQLDESKADLDTAWTQVTDDADRASVLSSKAMLAMIEGDLDLATRDIDDAIACAERAHDLRALARAFERSGSIALIRGDYARVEERCARALAISDGARDLRSTTNALTYQGIARLDRGRLAAATAAFHEARALYAEIDDAWSVAVCDAYLALIQLDVDFTTAVVDENQSAASVERGDDDTGVKLRSACADAHRVGHTRLEAFVEGLRGVWHHHRGEWALAEACCRRGLALAQHVKDILATCINAGHLAAILAMRGGADDEARFLLDRAHQFATLLPNPSAQRGLMALEACVAFTKGLDDAAASAKALAIVDPATSGVHVRLALRLLAQTEASAFSTTNTADDPQKTIAAPRSLSTATHAMSAPASTSSSSTPTPKRPESTGVATLTLGRAFSLVRFPSGDVVDFARRGAMRRILFALCDAHSKDDALSVHALIDKGWPDEKISTASGTTRVYSAIKSLRKMGLDAILVTRDDGYALDASCVVVEVSDRAAFDS